MQLPRVHGVRSHGQHGRIRWQLPIDDHRLPQRLVGRITAQLESRVGQIRRLATIQRVAANLNRDTERASS